MRKALLLILIIVFAMTGCTNGNVVLTEVSHQEVPVEEEREWEQETDIITPYQFLNLDLGNADEFYFEYTVFHHETKEREAGYFMKSGEKFASVFTAKDMNGNSVAVRELEMDGRVFYILDDVKIIKSFLSPAEDFLLYKLMDVTSGTEKRSYQEDSYQVYEYEKPFDQDENTLLNYRFFMQDGTLKKLEYSAGKQLMATYEFSEFQQTVKDHKVFEYPVGYSEEWYYYQYSGDNMPPWWDIGNDI